MNALAIVSRRRRIIAFGSLACVLLSVVGYREYFLARPVGRGPAGPSLDPGAFEMVWSQRPVMLLGIGDSVTAGFGADRDDHGYFARMVNNPSDEFDDMRGICLSRVLPHLKWENWAVSGSTSLAHHRRLRERLTEYSPDVFGVIVMTTGGNDIVHNYGRTPPQEGAMYGATLEQARVWIDDYETRLAEMLASIRMSFPGGCEIYLADIYDPTDGVGDAPSVYLPDWPDGLAIHKAYNAALHRCIERQEGVYLVPLHELFLGHGAHSRQFWRATYQRHDPYYWYFENIEDPNDRGHDAIRRLFLQTMVEHTRLRGSRDLLGPRSPASP